MRMGQVLYPELLRSVAETANVRRWAAASQIWRWYPTVESHSRQSIGIARRPTSPPGPIGMATLYGRAFSVLRWSQASRLDGEGKREAEPFYGSITEGCKLDRVSGRFHQIHQLPTAQRPARPIPPLTKSFNESTFACTLLVLLSSPFSPFGDRGQIIICQQLNAVL